MKPHEILARVAIEAIYKNNHVTIVEHGFPLNQGEVDKLAAYVAAAIEKHMECHPYIKWLRNDELKHIGWAVRLQYTDQFDGDKTTTGFGRWHLTAIESEAANITPPNQKVPVYIIAAEDKEEASDGE